MNFEFWANWGVAGVFAGTLLWFVLKSVATRLGRIEKDLEQAKTILIWLYTKQGGPPLGVDDTNDAD